MLQLFVSLVVAALVVAAPLQDERQGHAAAVAVLEGARTRAHRAEWKLTVPVAAAVVPARYTVVLVANYVDYAPSAWVMTVERDGDRAVAELLTHTGVFRGELPAAGLDEWLRTVQHMRGATQTWKGRGIGMVGITSASHMPYRAVTVSSRDPAAPLELALAAAKPLHRTLGGSSKVEGFVHTWAVRALERMVHGELGEATRVVVDEPLKREILRRFEGLSLGTGVKGDADRGGTEALLYAQLLTGWSYKPAIAPLQARGFAARAREIEVSTMPRGQQVAALAAMLCEGYEARKFAMPLARKLGDAALGPLLAALDCGIDEYALADMVTVVEGLTWSVEIKAALEDLVGRDPPERVRLTVDRVRLLRAHDDAARGRLTVVAGRPVVAPAYDMPDAQRIALAALVAEAVGDVSRRAAVVGVIRGVLATIPATAHETTSGMDALAGYLGEVGGVEDLPVLRGLLATQRGSVVVTIVEAMARHDVDAAVVAARREIDRYARGVKDTSFSWNVQSYHALLVRADARVAVKSLRRAQARMRRDAEVPAYELDGQRALIGYLSARTGEEKVAQALAYVAATGAYEAGMRAWLVARHRADGLDEAAVQRAFAVYTAARARRDTPW